MIQHSARRSPPSTRPRVEAATPLAAGSLQYTGRRYSVSRPEDAGADVALDAADPGAPQAATSVTATATAPPVPTEPATALFTSRG